MMPFCCVRLSVRVFAFEIRPVSHRHPCHPLCVARLALQDHMTRVESANTSQRGSTRPPQPIGPAAVGDTSPNAEGGASIPPSATASGPDSAQDSSSSSSSSPSPRAGDASSEAANGTSGSSPVPTDEAPASTPAAATGGDGEPSSSSGAGNSTPTASDGAGSATGTSNGPSSGAGARSFDRDGFAVRLLLPDASAGAIIGKSGCVIRALCESTSATIRLSPLDQQRPAGVVERLVTVGGTFNSVKDAVTAIFATLAADLRK
jgi:hypothetical protein